MVRRFGLPLLLIVACFDPNSGGTGGSTDTATETFDGTVSESTSPTSSTLGTETSATMSTETEPDTSATAGVCPVSVFGDGRFGETCFAP